jgi:hypothetical protein
MLVVAVVVVHQKKEHLAELEDLMLVVMAEQQIHQMDRLVQLIEVEVVVLMEKLMMEMLEMVVQEL